MYFVILTAVASNFTRGCGCTIKSNQCPWLASNLDLNCRHFEYDSCRDALWQPTAQLALVSVVQLQQVCPLSTSLSRKQRLVCTACSSDVCMSYVTSMSRYTAGKQVAKNVKHADGSNARGCHMHAQVRQDLPHSTCTHESQPSPT